MAITTFAAIDIGSYEISMKIFEFSKKIGFRQLNDVRYRLRSEREPIHREDWNLRSWMRSVGS